MRSIVLDIGNTGGKYGVFEEDALVSQGSFKEQEGLPQEVASQTFDNAIIASVSGGAVEQIKAGLSVSGSIIELSAQTALPVSNDYKTPATLGADRMAAAVAAHYFFPGRNCLTIDAGTAITYDFIDEHGHYQGGGIAPGIQMKFKALHNFTGRLPLVQGIHENFPLIGQTTQESLESGVLGGTVAEVEGMISAYRQKSDKLVVILCGGDAGFFESTIKHPIFVIPELVLIGLQRILRHNV
ncbi:type III pantothenate kinase [Pontibacter virosus]|uniref:Type III pantothenate kinase n=1 Tax=Pontibacter virosus TaxID=1765052 RepID=A0A2U1AVU3_9BACT|nr:type III pantothenate kinase [Pontibacter virosus]PVY40520.1 type III pantothenate kinase [Pontibacter virosus]